MSHLRGALLSGTAVAIAAVALAAGGCSASSSPPEAQTCDEFPGSVSALSFDADTNRFVSASASLLALVTNLNARVLNACVGIAVDLTVADTWTQKGPLNRGTADAEVTEACAQASRAVSAALHPATTDAGTQGPVACGLTVSGGGCAVDPNAQGACVAACAGGANCKAPTVPADCPPADVRGVCSGSCKSGATCEGSAGAPAQCQGACRGACSGECDGTVSMPVACDGTCSGHCVGSCTLGMKSSGICSGTCDGTCDGACTTTQGMALPCSGTCKGQCTGDCTLAPGSTIACGPRVDCKGACSGTYLTPTCEGELTQPKCGASANCQESCQSSAMIQASCQPSTVSLVCGAVNGPDLQALTTTLQANLPALLDVARAQGLLAQAAAGVLRGVGQAVTVSAGGLTGKALACARAAERAASGAEASIMNSIGASAAVGAAAKSGS